MDGRLISERFPRAAGYHPEWVLASYSSAANALWLTEWLAEALELKPSMRRVACQRRYSVVGM